MIDQMISFSFRYSRIQKFTNAVTLLMPCFSLSASLFFRIKALASRLVERFGGNIPEEREEIASLLAAGDYIADAVLSFAYRKKGAVIDSNACRVIFRVFGISSKGEARRNANVRRMAESILPSDRAMDFNWE